MSTGSSTGQSGILVEIHWRIIPPFYPLVRTLTELLERCGTTELEGRAIPDLCSGGPAGLALLAWNHARLGQTGLDRVYRRTDSIRRRCWIGRGFCAMLNDPADGGCFPSGLIWQSICWERPFPRRLTAGCGATRWPWHQPIGCGNNCSWKAIFKHGGLEPKINTFFLTALLRPQDKLKLLLDILRPAWFEFALLPLPPLLYPLYCIWRTVPAARKIYRDLAEASSCRGGKKVFAVRQDVRMGRRICEPLEGPVRSCLQ